MAGYLLDTQILWFCLKSPEKLSVEIEKIITSKKNKIFFSPESINEMIFSNLEKDLMPSEVYDALTNKETGFIPLELTTKDQDTLHNTPNKPDNKFSAVLYAQAKTNKITIISSRKIADKYNVSHLCN